jgi:hypothetical protein
MHSPPPEVVFTSQPPPAQETKQDDQVTLYVHPEAEPTTLSEAVAYVTLNPLTIETPTPPIHWIFVVDTSGSMETDVSPLSSLFMTTPSGQTRWTLALGLLDEIWSQLKAQRPQDRLSVFCFYSKTHHVIQNQLLETMSDSISTVLEQKKIRPRGMTDISVANTAVGTFLLTEPTLLDGTYTPVELFFTDGDATAGLMQPNQLKAQKKGYMDLFVKATGQAPLLWCGAISSDASADTVKALSEASARNLWSHIHTDEMVEFATEMALVVATALYSRCWTFQKQHYWLLPDAQACLYLSAAPDQVLVPEAHWSVLTCPELVTWSRWQHQLYQWEDKQNSFKKPLPEQKAALLVAEPKALSEERKLLLTEWQNQLQDMSYLQRDSPGESALVSSDTNRLQSTQTQWTPELIQNCEQLRLTLLKTVSEELEKLHSQPDHSRPYLKRQKSYIRDFCAASPVVQRTQTQYKQVYRSLTTGVTNGFDLETDLTLDPLSCPAPLCRQYQGLENSSHEVGLQPSHEVGLQPSHEVGLQPSHEVGQHDTSHCRIL